MYFVVFEKPDGSRTWTGYESKESFDEAWIEYNKHPKYNETVIAQGVTEEDAMALIRARDKENCDAYIASLPPMFQTPRYEKLIRGILED